MSSPLLRIKALIWAHSLIGTLLWAGYFAVLTNGPDQRIAAGIIAGLLVWVVALRPLGRYASSLPVDLPPARGLPGWLLAACAVGQLLGLAAGRNSHDGWLTVAYLLAGITLIARESISTAMEVPIHHRTWATCLLLVGFGFLRHLFGYFVTEVLGC